MYTLSSLNLTLAHPLSPLSFSIYLTGTLKQFADVEAGRVAVGHDREGRLVIVQIDGETWKRG